MPHHKSCIKRLHQSEEDRIRNHAQKTALRRILKQARANLDAGETVDLNEVYSRIDKEGIKGMIHKRKLFPYLFKRGTSSLCF